MMNKSGKIYLIPNLLAKDTFHSVFPEYNKLIIKKLRYFIVEDIRNARRFLRAWDNNIDIDAIKFEVIDKHSDYIPADKYLKPVLDGMDCGILSEAGSPCIADPGSAIVAAAHGKELKVVPLTGPSSIQMALEASGMNGQSFAFHGYLPIKAKERNSRLRELENMALRTGQSQIFMETPYRNSKLFDGLLSTLSPDTLLCIAANITSENEYIKTKSVKKWKRSKINLDKIPAIFIIGK